MNHSATDEAKAVRRARLAMRRDQGDDLLAAARYANAAAALSVQGLGAVAPLPTPAAVRALLPS